MTFETQDLPLAPRLRHHERWGLAVVILLLLGVVTWALTRPGVIVKEGREYQLLSYASTVTQVHAKKGKGTVMVPTYLITFAYVGEKGNRRSTISVPRLYLIKDESLAVNRIVWDTPFTIERLEYRQVRWNPGYAVPNREEPVLQEQPPLGKSR